MVENLTIFGYLKNFRLLDYGHATYQFKLRSSGNFEHVNCQAKFFNFKILWAIVHFAKIIKS